ncbi:MAG: mannonate dehydratase, partial [Planctomycetota bacterium]
MAINKRTRESEQKSVKSDRRTFGKTVLAGVLGGPAVLSSISQRAYGISSPAVFGKKGRGIKLALMLDIRDKERCILARQIGINHAIVPVNRTLRRIPRNQYVEALTKIKASYEEFGLTISGVESHPVAAEKIKLGLPGRDEEIQNYCAAIEALGKVGIPMCCYNFMAGIGWYRTKTDIAERGGALSSEFNNEIAKKQGLTRW